MSIDTHFDCWMQIIRHPAIAPALHVGEGRSTLDQVLDRITELSGTSSVSTDVETLREAARIMHPPKVAPGLWTTTERYLRLEADRLEAEHRAAQEKAAADAAREALIVKAASVTVTHPNGAVVSVGLPYARALADAGYLAEAVQP